jgi:biopolymer transport protein ExbB
MPVLPSLDISPIGIAVLAALALTSIAATAILIFKVIQFFRMGVGRTGQARRVVALWLAGDGAGALAGAETRRSVSLRVLYALMAGLRVRPDDRAYAQALAVQTAQEELSAMSRNMRGLEAVVQAAPMLGLLGTVIGMIEAFGRLAESTGAVDPAVLAGGIWTALITTAVGLGIAIVFYFAAIWLEGRITREREALESLMSSVLNGRVVAPAKR